MELFAWIGEDEHGSGKVGLKQALVPAGLTPLVSTDVLKLTRPYLLQQLATQASLYNVRMRLVRFALSEEIQVIDP